VAWHPLGWQPLAFSEIENFPRKVLAHHFSGVPLYGDFTTLKDEPWIGEADVLVGGTPCQAFSVAGLRQSLSDDRGNLSLEFVRLANAIDDLRPVGDGTIILWENVPGVLSVKDNAFGCFLAALVGNDAPLVPTGGKWTNAGLVVGPQRSAAWRILDAQYFGVAQRRRRVFVVASAREGFDPAEVLFEREGLRRDTAPRRDAGERTSSSVEGSAERSIQTSVKSHWDGDQYLHPTLNQSSNCGGVGYSNQEVFSQRGAYLAPAIVGTLTARGPKDFGASAVDAGHLMPIAIHPHVVGRSAQSGPQGKEYLDNGSAYTMDARGIAQAVAYDITGTGPGMVQGGRETDVHVALRARPPGASEGSTTTVVAQTIAFSSKDYGGDASAELSPTLRAMPHDGSHANGGGQVAIAFHPTQDPISSSDGSTHALGCGSSQGQASVAVAIGLDEEQNAVIEGFGTLKARMNGGGFEGTVMQTNMAVRRLTPRECELLQGFPDDWTLISDKTADGPRYKALGNSMAVPVMRWIGKRIHNMVVDNQK
jgi:DNA (cytosine-5)-methyltransferase 1